MESSESRHIAVVRRYFDGCNSGDLSELLATLDPQVVHFFLPATFPTVRGAEHLAKFWRKYKLTLQPTWRIDDIIAQGDKAVSEWSCLWTPPGESRRVMSRGTEWYAFRNDRISEVRAYFIADQAAGSELPGFPYAERGYLTA